MVPSMAQEDPLKKDGNPLQYSCLGNPMDRGACWATFHGDTKVQDMTQQRKNNSKPAQVWRKETKLIFLLISMPVSSVGQILCLNILIICVRESCSVMSDSLRPHGLYTPCTSPGQNTGVGSLSLLQGIFPTEGSNPGLLHCRWILYQLICKGSPRVLECVAYPFSSGSCQPRNQTGVSCIAGAFFTS